MRWGCDRRPLRDDERPVEVVDVVPVGGGLPGDLDAEFTAFMAEHADTLLHSAWLLVGNMDRARSARRNSDAAGFAKAATKDVPTTPQVSGSSSLL